MKNDIIEMLTDKKEVKKYLSETSGFESVYNIKRWLDWQIVSYFDNLNVTQIFNLFLFTTCYAGVDLVEDIYEYTTKKERKLFNEQIGYELFDNI